MKKHRTMARRAIPVALLLICSAILTLAASPLLLPVSIAVISGEKPGFGHFLALIRERDLIEAWTGYMSSASAQDGFLPGLALIFIIVVTVLGTAILSSSGKDQDRDVREGILGRQISTSSLSKIIRENFAWDGESAGDAKPPRGIVVGWARRRMIVVPGLHFIVIAPSGSGKTRSCVLPTIDFLSLAQEDSLIVTDPSLEIYIATRKALEKRGYEVYLIDFENPRMGCRWSPLELINRLHEKGDASAAEARARDIGAAFFPTKGGDNDFFISAAGGVFAAVAYVIATSPEVPDEARNVWSVVKTIISGTVANPGALKEWLLRFGVDSPAVTMAAAYLSAQGKPEASILSSLQDGLQPYTGTGIRWLTSASDLKIDDAINRRSAVFLHTLGPGSPTNRIASLLLSQHYEEAVRLGKRRGIPPYWAILDEAHSLPTGAFNMVNALENSRKYGGHYVLFLQSISGLDALRKGKADGTRDAILANADAKILFRAGDVETAGYFEKLSGFKTIRVRNIGQTRRGMLDQSTSNAGFTEQKMPLWPVGDLLDRNPAKEGVLVVKAASDGNDAGRYEIPIADASKTFAKEHFGTLGTLQFERDVIGKTLDELEAEAKTKSLEVPAWTPDFSPHGEEPKTIEEDEWAAWD